MDYKTAVHWLFSRFPAYQNVGASAYKPDLINVKLLLKSLDNPQNDLKFIHIAGTNGKGSTSHILAALCQAHGLKTGIFTSPHLVDFRERIKINGLQISENRVVEWVSQKIPALKIDFEPSFFELTLALALNYFKEEQCDVCIIETGLGGRLDATNVIQPVLSVITNIGFDHQMFLGNSRPEIASEKAGIIKKNTPILIAERDPETESVFVQKSLSKHATLRWVDFSESIESDLLGDFQQLNLNTAKQAFLWYCNLEGIQCDERKMSDALKNVAGITDFKGRFQLVQVRPRIIFDVAHNISGIRVLMREIQKMKYTNLHLIFGTSNDKELGEVFTVLPETAQFYFTEFSNLRTRKLDEWSSLGVQRNLNFQLFANPKSALESAKLNAQDDDLILVFGSFFLIGDIFS